MAMYSMRSERAFCERLNYDMLFKWFLDLPIDAPSFDASTFSKNRQRLLGHNIADEFFAAVVRQAKLRRYMSSDHFSVDGTLLEAWASHKSFKPKDPDNNPDPDSEGDSPKGRNVEAKWHGQKRSNDTHASTTDPEAMLYRKSNNTAATLCYAGHLLIVHRNGLRCRRPRRRFHPARRPEHLEPKVRDRWAHHPTSRLRIQPTDPQTCRGTLRLGENRRRWTETQIQRPRPQPGLVQNDHRRLQPDPDHRPRHSTRLTDAGPDPPPATTSPHPPIRQPESASETDTRPHNRHRPEPGSGRHLHFQHPASPSTTATT